MKAKSIHGPRISLVPFDETFITGEYVSWLNDRELMQFSEQRHRKHTLKSCRDYARGFDHKTRFLWAIVLKDNAGTHIGNINSYLDSRHGIADIGLLIGAPDCQGKGYGKEAWQGIMNVLFSEYDVRKITGGCLANNRAMQNIMKKCDMIPDGVRNRHLVWNNTTQDVIHMAKFLETFKRDYNFTFS